MAILLLFHPLKQGFDLLFDGVVHLDRNVHTSTRMDHLRRLLDGFGAIGGGGFSPDTASSDVDCSPCRPQFDGDPTPGATRGTRDDGHLAS